MKTSDFNFELPERLIAQTPILDRAASRLLILNKKTGEIQHSSFRSVTDLMQNGDCLVLNETKVIPARLIGERTGTGARVELLLLKRLDEKHWEVLVNPGKKARPGDEIHFGGGELSAVIEHVTETGNRIARFEFDGIFEQKLNALGDMPLPPYIKEKLEDGQRYQTVYAKNEGSAAAPTAGLHFTEQVLEELSQKGVRIARITLHVGLGTFRPVKVDDITQHHMHSEFYNIEPEQAELINTSKAAGGRIIAVGTTSCRTLESRAVDGRIIPGSGWTDIFIYPGYDFKIVDGLITNFHLPESTLIMLVSALAGRDAVLNAYAEAVAQEYRFFSFGDCMTII